MRYKKLIAQSKAHIEQYAVDINNEVFLYTFSQGAKWMFDRLNEQDNNSGLVFDANLNYNVYGSIKYGISMLAMFSSIFWFYQFSVFLVPLSVVVFYFFEVHFLFLFPLLIDKEEGPFLNSIRQTYRIGIFKTMLTVIPIGGFMIFGLFYMKSPFRNWYIGCLSVVIWYQNEVRDRLSS